MCRKIGIRDVVAGMEFEVVSPIELNSFAVFKINKNNKVQNHILRKGDVLTVIQTINNDQVEFHVQNGDSFVAFWSPFKNETKPRFDTAPVLRENTVAYYLNENELSELTFEVVKKEFFAQITNRHWNVEYPVVMGVRYKYGMKSNFNLDVIKAYKTDKNIALLEKIFIDKLIENWTVIQSLTKNKKNNTKIKLFTRRKKVIMEISELPDDLEVAISQVKDLIENYKNDSKTHIAVK